MISIDNEEYPERNWKLCLIKKQNKHEDMYKIMSH